MCTRKTINVITLGCSKNQVDSEYLIRSLKSNDYHVLHNADIETDIVVVNTCGFISDAKQESVDTILNCIRGKKNGKIQKVLVTGCLSQRYMTELQQEIPEVDRFFGINGYIEIPEYLQITPNKEEKGRREVSEPKSTAYLKIAEGCSRNCSFCAIPMIKGKYRSRTIEDVVDEAKWLSQQGVKELILIAQDLTYYGRDIYQKPALSLLITALAKIDNIRWIRLQYMYPEGFTDDLLEVISKEDKVCKYLDIPFQHINDDVLKGMRRGMNKERSFELIRQIRNKVPGIALRTTLLVGFPSETEAAFDELVEFVEHVRFERLGVFVYSHEENTIAANTFDDLIADDVKQQRYDQIMKTQNDISNTLNESKIGGLFKVLIDVEETDFYIGRTQYDSLEVDNEVFIEKQKTVCPVTPGNFYDVMIIKADAYSLYGMIQGDEPGKF